MGLNQKTAEAISEQIKKFGDKIDWHKPWVSVYHQNLISGRAYHGINAFMTWLLSQVNEYKSFKWATLKQWNEKGYKIRAGEKSTRVFFWKPLTYNAEVKNSEGEITLEEKEYWMLKVYYVFNGSQIDGYNIEDEFKVEKKELLKLENFDEMVTNYGITIGHSQSRCCYIPLEHTIQMVDKKFFAKESEWYSTLAHELIHSTAKVLGRKKDGQVNPFGSPEYAFEEVVAETGAGLLMQHFGIDYFLQENNIAYIKGWLESCQKQPELLVKATSLAQKAADYLLKFIEEKQLEEN